MTQPLPFVRNRYDDPPDPVRFPTTLPASPEAEAAFLACCLTATEYARAGVVAGVDAESFLDDKRRRLWQVIVKNLEGGGSVDDLSLAVYVSENPACGLTQADIFGTLEAPFSTLEVARYCRILLDSARLRRKTRAAWALLEALQQGDAEAAGRAEQEIGRVGMLSSNRLPEIRHGLATLESAEAAPRPVVDGLIHAGSKVMLGGGSKSFKTWSLLDLGVSIATGRPWWGLPTSPGRVLYLNFELQPFFCTERLKAILEAKKIAAEELTGFDLWHLRGYSADLGELVPSFLSRTAGGQYAAIILDPIYKCLGERDENLAGDVASLLNQVEALAVRSGAAVIFGHHFSKGSQAEKTSQDRVSGSGVWARDPDTLITLTPHEEDDHFSVEYVLRNFRNRGAHVVKWSFPLMVPAPEHNPERLRTKAGRPSSFGVEDIMQTLDENGSLSFAEWRDKVVDAGTSASTFKRLLSKARELDLVTNIAGRYTRRLPEQPQSKASK